MNQSFPTVDLFFTFFLFASVPSTHCNQQKVILAEQDHSKTKNKKQTRNKIASDVSICGKTQKATTPQKNKKDGEEKKCHFGWSTKCHVS
jgi:hypothetical protein